jgi:Fe-S cluster assembly protein SufD
LGNLRSMMTNNKKNTEINSDHHEFIFDKDLIRKISPNEAGFVRRTTAYNYYQQLPMPSKKIRAWRKSGLDKFLPEKFLINSAKHPNSLGNFNIKQTILPEDDLAGSIILTSDGKAKVKLNKDLEDQGVILCSLRTAEEVHSKITESLIGRIVAVDESKFSALTHSFDTDGVLFFVPKGIVIQKPIQSVFIAEGDHQVRTFHLLILLEEEASVTFIQEWVGLGNKQTVNLHSGVIEVKVGEGAELNLVEIQSWNDAWWSILHERAELLKNSHINWMTYADGSYYSRTFLGVNLIGENARAEMTGISLNTTNTQIDFDTYQQHSAANTKSDLLFKNAMANDSRSVWSGMIKVEKSALKTDGYQANKNLLLCGSPHVESIPGLEILADDVRCSHGVTVGEIDTDQVFYLTSRGIPEGEAKQLIAEGFLSASLSRIENEVIREKIKARIHKKLSELFCE